MSGSSDAPRAARSDAFYKVGQSLIGEPISADLTCLPGLFSALCPQIAIPLHYKVLFRKYLPRYVYKHLFDRRKRQHVQCS